MKRISAKEFRDQGFLQEVNLCFLHPLGLALEVITNAAGEEIQRAGEDSPARLGDPASAGHGQGSATERADKEGSLTMCWCQCGAGDRTTEKPALGPCKGCVCVFCFGASGPRATVVVRDYSAFSKGLIRDYRNRFGEDPMWLPPAGIAFSDLHAGKVIGYEALCRAITLRSDTEPCGEPKCLMHTATPCKVCSRTWRRGMSQAERRLRKMGLWLSKDEEKGFLKAITDDRSLLPDVKQRRMTTESSHVR